MKQKQQQPAEWPDDIRQGPKVRGFTFWEALVLAGGAVEPIGEGGDPRPLADYLASGTPLSTQEQAALAEMQRLPPARMPRGREHGKSKQLRSLVNEAERQEALRVLAEQAAWLAQHPTTSRGKPRRYVPDAVTKKMIGPGFEAERIKRLLKNKRRLAST